MGVGLLVSFAGLLAGAVGCSGRSDRISRHHSSGGLAGAAAGSSGTAGGGGVGGTIGIGGTGATACVRGFEPIDDADPHCGDEACAALPESDPRMEYSRHCCTNEGRCGSGAESFFASACFERDRAGTPSDECPDETIFVYFDAISGIELHDSFLGCCLPDGRCGLDTSATVGAGCVERTELSDAVRAACTHENFDVLFEPMRCGP